MAESAGWLARNAFDLLSAAGIIAGLFFTAAAYRADIRSRRLSSLISLTQQHRDIWKEFLQRPELRRVTDPEADLKAAPVTPAESRFVVFLVLQLHCWFEAARTGEIAELEGVSRDAAEFFALPVPCRVWREKRRFWNADFVVFVESRGRGA